MLTPEQSTGASDAVLQILDTSHIHLSGVFARHG
jgi:hypothetical protein